MSKIQKHDAAALDRLKNRREKRISACNSHTENEVYMEKFMEGLHRLEIGDGAQQQSDTFNKHSKQNEHVLSSSTSSSIRAFDVVKHEALQAHACKATSKGTEYNSHLPGTVADGWIAGPINETGTALDVSDRPILCSDACWETGEVVVGSSDHALYVLDVEHGTQKRRLYGKHNGHKEWVSCVAYLQDGSILSGGMDSQLCLWQNGSSRSRFLEGHTGSISQVCQVKTGALAASASYDKSLRLWSIRGKCQGCLQGHNAPVLELQTDNCSRLLSGDRSGTVRVWDIMTGECTWELRHVHKGHVSAVAWADSSGGNSAWLGCFATGGQDGRLRLWDPRAHDHVAKVALHTNHAGKGAVSGIIMGGAALGYLAATCGADHTIRILDSRSGVGQLACVPLPDYPYSFTAAGGLIIVGCSNGVVQIVDSHVMQTQYSLSVSDSAIRTLQVSRDKLVCAGDAGSTVFYKFADQ